MPSTSERAAIGLALGVILIACGMWLQFHSSDFMNVTMNGVRHAPYSAIFSQIADFLMYGGGVLFIAAMVVWMTARPVVTPPN